MADWARLANTTINEYLRGEEVQVMRNRKILALLQDRGRVTFNHNGLLLDWKVRYRRAPLTGFIDGDTLTFSRQNRWRTAQVDWRGYAMTDQMTEFEKQKNKGDAAIVKVWSEMAKLLIDDITDQFGDEPYIDGGAAGNNKRFLGIESFMGNSGAGTKQPIGKPNSTYAGNVCTLGNYGGTWTSTGSTTDSPGGDWPTGTGDAHFDFWSPLIVDYTSAIATSTAAGTTGWQASTKTWANTCLEAVRYGIINSQKNKSKKSMLDLIALEIEMFRLFKDKAQTEEQLFVTRGDSGDGLYKLGFKDVINFDGIDLTSEYGIPRFTGYGWNIDAVELCSLLDVLIKSKGPDYDMASDAYRFAVFIMGNFKFNNVRQFVKYKNVT
jgi:hypothetical protein